MGILDSATSNIVYSKGQQLDQARITSLDSTKGSLAYLFPAAIPNPLKRFASVTPLFMMGCIEKSKVGGTANPIDSSINYMILGSGGNVGQSDPRGIGKRVTTAYGTPEYYINNFEVKTAAASPDGVSNLSTTQIKFDIFEPYSVSLFLQSLQIAAIKSGYENYLDAVFMLRVDFVGWDENISSSIEPIAQRFFPFKFVNATIKATEAGSTYNCNCAPYQAIAAFDENMELKSSATLKGKTVYDMVNELQKNLNEQAKTNAGGSQPNEYFIDFLNSTGERSEKIAFAKIIQNNASSPNPPTYSQGTLTNLPEDTTVSVLSFGQNNSNPTTITQVLTEIMLNSEYCKDALKPEAVDSSGFIKWFKIITDFKFIGSTDPARAEIPKKFSYYIVEYQAHADVIKSPTSGESDTNAICKKVSKKFEYLNTGQNEDILKWDLDFDMTFYKAALTKAPTNTSANEPGRQSAATEDAYVGLAAGNNTDQWKRVTGVTRVAQSSQDIILPNTGASGGDQAVMVARLFEKAMRQSADQSMLVINLEILGDPYFLAQAGGLTKTQFPTKEGSMIGSDGAMAADASTIMFFIGFKTPIDAPAEGSLFTFPEGYNPFSGLYVLIQASSFIKDGVFTQRLRARRLLDQVPLGVTAITSNPTLLYKEQGKTAPPLNELDSAPAAEAKTE